METILALNTVTSTLMVYGGIEPAFGREVSRTEQTPHSLQTPWKFNILPGILRTTAGVFLIHEPTKAIT